MGVTLCISQRRNGKEDMIKFFFENMVACIPTLTVAASSSRKLNGSDPCSCIFIRGKYGNQNSKSSQFQFNKHVILHCKQNILFSNVLRLCRYR